MEAQNLRLHLHGDQSLGGSHRPAVQRPPAQSVPSRQCWPVAQPGQSPPQSTSVSSPSARPFPQLPGAPICGGDSIGSERPVVPEPDVPYSIFALPISKFAGGSAISSRATAWVSPSPVTPDDPDDPDDKR